MQKTPSAFWCVAINKDPCETRSTSATPAHHLWGKGTSPDRCVNPCLPPRSPRDKGRGPRKEAPSHHRLTRTKARPPWGEGEILPDQQLNSWLTPRRPRDKSSRPNRLQRINGDTALWSQPKGSRVLCLQTHRIKDYKNAFIFNPLNQGVFHCELSGIKQKRQKAWFENTYELVRLPIESAKMCSNNTSFTRFILEHKIHITEITYTIKYCYMVS